MRRLVTPSFAEAKPRRYTAIVGFTNLSGRQVSQTVHTWAMSPEEALGNFKLSYRFPDLTVILSTRTAAK